ncbi:MAG: hypothetical protein Q9168_008198 [Polycauliona sp. 1 TL-2023]
MPSSSSHGSGESTVRRSSSSSSRTHGSSSSTRHHASKRPSAMPHIDEDRSTSHHTDNSGFHSKAMVRREGSNADGLHVLVVIDLAALSLHRLRGQAPMVMVVSARLGMIDIRLMDPALRIPTKNTLAPLRHRPHDRAPMDMSVRLGMTDIRPTALALRTLLVIARTAILLTAPALRIVIASLGMTDIQLTAPAPHVRIAIARPEMTDIQPTDQALRTLLAIATPEAATPLEEALPAPSSHPSTEDIRPPDYSRDTGYTAAYAHLDDDSLSRRLSSSLNIHSDDDDDDYYGGLTSQFDALTTFCARPSRSYGDIDRAESQLSEYTKGYMAALEYNDSSSRYDDDYGFSSTREDRMLRGLSRDTIKRYAYNYAERHDVPKPIGSYLTKLYAGSWACQMLIDKMRDDRY